MRILEGLQSSLGKMRVWSDRSSRSDVFCLEVVPRNFVKFTGNNCAGVSFLIKLQGVLQLYLKRDYGTDVFL